MEKMHYFATTTNKAKKKGNNNNGNGHNNKRSSSSSSSSSGSNNDNHHKMKGVMRLSTDPQSVAARERRHRISDRFKILQSLVPGGTKMDTVSMLEQAIQYVKFLKAQIWLHQNIIMNNNNNNTTMDLVPPDCDTDYNTALYHNNNDCGSNLAFDHQISLPFPLPHHHHQCSCCFPSHETASFDQGNAYAKYH